MLNDDSAKYITKNCFAHLSKIVLTQLGIGVRRETLMQFNVAQLLKEPVGSTRRYALNEDVEDVSELDPEINPLSPLIGTIQVMRTNSGVLVTGQLSTALRVNCRRCLEPIVMPVRFELEESFRPLTEVETGRYLRPDEYQGESADYEDEALVINEHHILDASEIIRQAIWLNLPMYPGCNWAGNGECPNLVALRTAMAANDEAETQAEDVLPEGVDPRWSALLKLRGQTSREDD